MQRGIRPSAYNVWRKEAASALQLPTLDPNSPEPLYVQIKRWMEDEILSGRWPARYKLPAEDDLAQRLGVSRGTLRRAIQELTIAGLLTQIHGKGTFVASTILEQPLAQELIAFSEHLERRGIPYETKVIMQEIRTPSPRVAQLLQLPPTASIFELRRIRLVSDEPIAYMENRVPIHFVPGIASLDFSKERLFKVLEDNYDLKLDWGYRTFEAVPAPDHIATYLQIPAGSPLLYVEQVVYITNGLPIEQSDVWLRADRFRISAVVGRVKTPKAKIPRIADPSKFTF